MLMLARGLNVGLSHHVRAYFVYDTIDNSACLFYFLVFVFCTVLLMDLLAYCTLNNEQ